MSDSSEDLLVEYMHQALEGADDASRLFFKELLKTELYVIERYQDLTLSHMPNYPNDFVSIMGIQADEQVFVPAFTKAAFIEEWFGSPLKCKSMLTTKLLETLPSEWWVCINPGREIEKELSPWEIEQLKNGDAGIEAVVEELASLRNTLPLNLQPLDDQELPELRQSLITYCEQHTKIKTLYLLKSGANEEQENKTSDLIQLNAGLIAPDVHATELESLHNEIQALIEKHLIGRGTIKVSSGAATQDDVALSIFAHFKPLYEAPKTSIWTPFLQLLKL